MSALIVGDDGEPSLRHGFEQRDEVFLAPGEARNEDHGRAAFVHATFNSGVGG